MTVDHRPSDDRHSDDRHSDDRHSADRHSADRHSDETASGELHRSVAARLTEHEQQYTANRRAVVDALVAAGAPITLPDLLAADASLAQSSAYRSLAVLIDAGVVRRLVHVGDHALFELHEHLTEHHHHLVCESCGAVVDVTLPDRVEAQMDHTFDEVSAAAGFTPRHHTVDIYGTCAECS